MYLVTGASGFVGRALLTELCPLAAARGTQVVALCRDPAAFARQAWAAALPALRPIQGELPGSATWAARVPAGPLHCVFHLAAVVHHSRHGHEGPTQINVEGTREVVAFARSRGARTVFVSTSGTVGCSADPQAAPDETAPFCRAQVQHWPYYASKIAAEELARAAAPAATDCVIVRPPMIMGPGDTRFRATGTLVRLLRGRLPFALPGGIHFVDVRDVVAALLAIADHPAPQPVYHLPGHAPSIVDFLATVAKIADCRAPRWVLAPALARRMARLDAGIGRLLRGAPLHLFIDEVVVEMGCAFWGLSSRYAARDLGYAPRPAEQILRDTVAFIRAHRDDCGGR